VLDGGIGVTPETPGHTESSSDVEININSGDGADAHKD
jgi:hypothetical protein